MTHWKASSWKGVYEANGRSIQLIVEPHEIATVDIWYWKIINEEGTTVSSGCRDTDGQAKSSATRCAKSYVRNPHRFSKA